ncbi:ABC transporter ATP-binding protein [Microbacterium sp. 179-B 1A2 NHS]|uniref:ABC transporter ATP-binding protein n=1 Tax=Microbacterium sp. 179-B 1A2 NHS TaxID=3142383 RepID=UPI0039A00FAE
MTAVPPRPQPDPDVDPGVVAAVPPPPPAVSAAEAAAARAEAAGFEPFLVAEATPPRIPPVPPLPSAVTSKPDADAAETVDATVARPEAAATAPKGPSKKKRGARRKSRASAPPKPDVSAAVLAARLEQERSAAPAEADADEDSGPAIEAEPETIPETEPETEAEAEAEPVVETESEPVVKPEPAPAPEPVVEREPEPEAEPIAASEVETEVEPEPPVEPELKPEPALKPEPVTLSEPVAETGTQVAPESGETSALVDLFDDEIDEDTHVNPIQVIVTERIAPPRDTEDIDAESDLPVPASAEPTAVEPGGEAPALRLTGVGKSFGQTRAVDDLHLEIPTGTFYGLVGPNGAGKTTTLSMIAGLLRPDAGRIEIAGLDMERDPDAAKAQMGVLPDRLRTFDRLTGRQLLHYYGVLRGLRYAVVAERSADLARAFDLTAALGRPVSDYSAGMTKKIMLAGAMIHSPRLLVLDEPFEAVDPVSSAAILDILSTYVAHGGTVILSSHGMDLVERVCDGVAVIVGGQVLARGTVDEVRGDHTLAERFVQLAGSRSDVEGLEWLHTYSD